MRGHLVLVLQPFVDEGTYSESMFLSPVTSNEVEDFISQMDNNKTTGPFSIPVPLLKILKTHITPLLSSLINDSFLCGTFPNKLKLAKVTPVFKKGSRQDKDNYRPISVLSIFIKYLKKLCISAFTVILNVIAFSTHFNLVLGGSTQPIMHF